MIEFLVEQTRNTVRVSAHEKNKTVPIAQLLNDAQHQAIGELFSEVHKRRESDEEYAVLEGPHTVLELQLLKALAGKELAGAIVHQHPKKARIVLAEGPHPFVLAMRLGASDKRLDGKSGFVFGSDELWAATNYNNRLHLAPLDTKHPDVLAELKQQHHTHIPQTYVGAFIERNYYDGGRLGRVHTPENEKIVTVKAADPLGKIYLYESEKELRLHLRYGYHGQEAHGHEQRTPYFCKDNVLCKVERDAEKEERLRALLEDTSVDTVGGSYRPRDPHIWLQDALPALLEKGFEVYGHDRLMEHDAEEQEAELSVSARTGMDWLELDVDARVDGEPIPFDVLKALLLKRERCVRLDGKTKVLPARWMELAPIIGTFEEGEGGIRALPSQYPLVDSLLSVADRKSTPPELEEMKERFAQFEKIPEVDVPEGFVGELRNYQKEGYYWLRFLHDNRMGGLLADDMGLGKSVQTLTVLLHAHQQAPGKKSLIIVPTSLVHNWRKEMEKFTPSLGAYIHHGSGKLRREEIEERTESLVITTYNTVRNELDVLGGFQWLYVVCDEAQYIKNPTTQTARAIHDLRATHRLAITGTPIENNSLELWSHIHFANPGMLGDLSYYKQEYAKHLDEVFAEEKAAALRRVTRPFILRREKSVVAKDLPEKQIMVRYHDMDPSQRELYDNVRRAYQERILSNLDDNKRTTTVFEGLLRLRQIANHPRLAFDDYHGSSGKFSSFCEQMVEAIREGHKILVFSSFLGLLKMAEEALDEYDIPSVYLDGSTDDRQGLVDEFQEDESIKAFLISLKAGGVGLTLTAADYVFILDPWWNPAAEMQAIDRAHRIGQTKPVFVYKLIARDTVEEKILELQHKKRELNDAIVVTEEDARKRLSKQDVDFLFE